jgi:hypothetical protein
MRAPHASSVRNGAAYQDSWSVVLMTVASGLNSRFKGLATLHEAWVGHSALFPSSRCHFAIGMHR